MLLLILGLLLFLGAHSLAIVSPQARHAAASRLGEGVFKGTYSLLSLVGLVLIVWGYSAARAAPVVLYTPPMGLRHATVLLMLPAFVLLVAAYTRGHIKARTKHPMLAATKLWAVSHLLSNGTFADVLLFGSVLAWAVADRISVARRERQAVAASSMTSTADNPKGLHDVIAVVVGLAIFAWFLLQGHAWLIGVSPITPTGPRP
jgi:uncharacterized membrane protein